MVAFVGASKEFFALAKVRRRPGVAIGQRCENHSPMCGTDR
jgi:hypothetical protein